MAIIMLLAIALIANQAYAQAFVGPAPVDQRAYTRDHPIDPARLLLVTQSGRYDMVPGFDCDWLHGNMDVLLLAGDGQVRDVVPLSGMATCSVLLTVLRDSTPCLTDDAGNCEAALEDA
jgi:hypothetical protein